VGRIWFTGKRHPPIIPVACCSALFGANRGSSAHRLTQYRIQLQSQLSVPVVLSCLASFREWATAGGEGQSVLVSGSLLLLMFRWAVHRKRIPSKTRWGGQGGHSAKRPDWACKPNHFPVSVSQKENFAIFARACFTLQAQLWQLGAGARVRRHPVANQGALRTRD
jgi:hypothetical protein